MMYQGEIGVTVLDNFMAEPERLDILSQFDDMELSTVCTSDGKGGIHDARTGNRKFIVHDATYVIYLMCERISYFVGLPLENAEKMQLLHYSDGEKYDPHFDAFNEKSPHWEHYGKRGGQRLVTVMGYLTDNNNGGGTLFPTAGLQVYPRKRRLLVFNNVLDDRSKPHPDSFHGGMPVTDGEKKCFTLWFRENPINEQQ